MKIGWFSTGRDEAARHLLQVVQRSIERDEINGEIIFAFSNRELGESRESDLFFDLVCNYHIPLIQFSSGKFKAARDIEAETKDKALAQYRIEYDREIMSRLQGFTPDLCVLAGYMLIVGNEMCSQYNMINLHPAAPGGPTGSWQDVIWTLIEARAGESGVMMHLVTTELDRGPVITYCTFSIVGEPLDKYWQEVKNSSAVEIRNTQGENNALFQLIRKQELAREFPLIVATLAALSSGKINIEHGIPIDNRGEPISGYNLTNEVNKILEMKWI